MKKALENQQSRVQESDFAKQKQHDLMTKTPIVKLLFKLSLPSVMSMLISSIYNMVDTYFVSQLGTVPALLLSSISNNSCYSGRRIYAWQWSRK